MTNETIVDRVVDRLKKAPIGDLITEEDLHDIVKQAIPKTFFEERSVVVGSGYNQRAEKREPVIIEIMRDLLKEEAKSLMAKWVNENRETLLEYWKSVLDNGIREYVLKLQEEETRAHIRQALAPMVEALNEERYRSGLPPIMMP